MISERDVSAAIGSTAYGSDGESVGTVETFYTDDRTGATTWVSVSSGLLGTRRAIAPAEDATFADGRLQLAVPSDAVSSAPRLGGEHLSPEEEDGLRRHYARGQAPAGDDIEAAPRIDPAATTPVSQAAPAVGVPDRSDAVPDRTDAVPDRSDAVADRGDGSMVRREEQLRVGTEQVAARRMRVVKYVVTEEVQVTVPIRREEIRIEEVPLGTAGGGDGEVMVTEGDPLGGEQYASGAVTGGLPDEIVLHAERPVVTVEVVPVERVRLTTETVAGHTSVSETVQREQVTVDQHPVPRGS